MATFEIEPSVTSTLPTLQVVVVTARVPDNQGTNEHVAQYAKVLQRFYPSEKKQDLIFE